MNNPPKTPLSDKKEDLGFEWNQPMVNWFDPGMLVNTGIKAVLSELFGSYADKREIQAALKHERKVHDYSNGSSDIWIDFIADLGDGWNSTYSMAKLLASEKLVFQTGSQPVETRRGRLLIMGGDEVYPTSTREEYNNRTVGPYQSALPYVENEKEAPHLYAIPGNHDWYDGLTSFTRLFFQKRWIGGWQTQQSRSYFAIKLPNNWWLWGIDIQLESDIDKPQLHYFEEVAESMSEGDQVILCTAQPDWVFPATKDAPDAFKNLAYFEKNVIRKKGVLAVTLTGDLHHYCRYEDEHGKRQKITAGGGGAYLYPTHRMPEPLKLKEADETVTLSRGDKIYPDEKTSKRLVRNALLLPLKNWKFGMTLGGLYLLLGWVLQFASIATGNLFLNSLSAPLGAGNFVDVLKAYLYTIQLSPSSVVFLLLIVAGLYAFCDGKGWRRFIGLVHGVAHVFLNVFLIWLFTHLNLSLGFEERTLTNSLLFTIEMFTVGGLLGGFLMGVYLYLGGRFLNYNMNEAFSCQSIADYKCFLRLHLNKDGKLTIFPIGVDKVCKKWRFNPKAKDGESWFEPKAGHELKPHLIENPIEIKLTS